MPILVAVRFKEELCDRCIAGIAASKSAEGMDAPFRRLLCVLQVAPFAMS
jgi:hypothetical protein